MQRKGYGKKRQEAKKQGGKEAKRQRGKEAGKKDS
jgi:hypothetical protein